MKSPSKDSVDKAFQLETGFRSRNLRSALIQTAKKNTNNKVRKQRLIKTRTDEKGTIIGVW